MEQRRDYQKPAIQDWGTVTQLTATGHLYTYLCQRYPQLWFCDTKGGSVPHGNL